MQKNNCAQLAVFYETVTAKDTEIEVPAKNCQVGSRNL